ncbi:MAG: DUF1501 domain-containing protein [Planctomycetota bacterium]|nr:DUF1501 domain-containing protein [Planctomycetota bacterium]
MLTMLGSQRQFCDGITRRETLKAGALSALGGFGLPQLLQAEQAREHVWSGKAKSVICLYLLGGAPWQDMYDMKPKASSDVRGEFHPIATNAPGIDVCEHLPLHTKWMDRSAIVRSINHRAGCHNCIPSYTGWEVPETDLSNLKETHPPSMGSVCEYLSGGRADSPAYVYMPCYLGWGQAIRRPGPTAGFLGSRFDPLYTECVPTIDNPPEDPYSPQPLRGMPYIPHTRLSGEMTVDRLSTRQTLLQQLDGERFRIDQQGRLGSFNREEQRAWSLLTSSKVRDAFDLDKVDPQLRDRYTRTLFGQSALIARRLVEAGVRFINVTWDCYWERLKLQLHCWDTHSQNFQLLKKYNLPYLDAVYNALMQDLSDSGLLDETLVLVMSDFGRTPKINTNAGRDHWTFCYSMLFCGAGIKGGTVYGASDSQAAYPALNPVSTADVCSTIYQALGIDHEMPVYDKVGRPVAINHGGSPIREILA